MRLPLSLMISLLSSTALAAKPSLELDADVISASAESPAERYRVRHSSSATRSYAPLEEIPQAISVIPAQVLNDLNSPRIDRALDFAGGVSRQNNFGGLSFYSYSVRGLTTTELYRNGFAVSRGSYSAPDAAVIERLDVLKGPAAALFGRGDPGGLINIVSKRPEARNFAQLNVSAGSWDRYRTSLDANAVLNDDASLLGRVNLASEDNGSFRDHVGSRRQLASPSLSWQLSTDTLLQIDGEFSRTDSVFDRGIPAVDGKMGAVGRRTFLGEPNDGRIRNNNQLLQVSLEHQLNEAWKLRLANHYSQGTLRGAASEPSARIGEYMTRFYRERDFQWNDSITHAELHGLVNALGWEHQLLLGLEYENYRNSQKYPQSVTGLGYGQNIYKPVYGQTKPALVNPNSFFEHTESYALNLQDQIRFNERWGALLGLRAERIEQRNEVRATSRKTEQKDDVLIPRVGITYQWRPELTLFASASTSYKPNAMGARGQSFDPEEGLGYEAGIKWSSPDDRLGLTAALFHIDKENVLTPDPANPGDNIAAGKVRSRGLDLQLSGQLSDALRVIAAYAYIDAEVRKDNSIKAGSELLGVPRHSGSAMAVYQWQNGAWRGVEFGAAINAVGNRSGQLGSRFELAGYTTVDVLARVPLSDDLSLGLNLNNLLDRRYYERSSNANWVLPGEPRNFTLSLSMNL